MTSAELTEKLQAFGERVRGEVPAVLRYNQTTTNAGGICYVDQPDMPHRVRPWCDALEIGAAFRILPEGLTREEWIAKLRSFQDPATGLVPEYIPEDHPQESFVPGHGLEQDMYNTMIVIYALECLGAAPAYPVAHAEAIQAKALVEMLGNLNWKNEAWGAGHRIDCYASCLSPNQRYFGGGQQVDVIFTWLDAHVDVTSGLWGSWRKEDRWLQPVNGFYRLARGTYAQFDRPLPEPVKAIDTILLHAKDPEFFGRGRGNACNVLDVVHPLWLCLKQTDYRRSEAEAWVRTRLPETLARWQPGRGLAFDPVADTHWGKPGLQGTEMTLSIIYLMADLLGLSEPLAWKPNGVHRLQPAIQAERCL